jgi:SAM-dependent methyltransferase
MVTDSANAYEIYALDFLNIRDKSTIGEDIVERWARSLQPRTEVIEIACGGGFPVTRILLDKGLSLWAIDSSPTLLANFQTRFPNIPVQCARAQESDYFGRKYDAAISIGLIFLLDEPDQISVIHRISEILLPGGRFLFTAPVEIGTWKDVNTGHECRSLGVDRYEKILMESGFRVIAKYEDEGKNNYYEAEKLDEAAL